MGTTWPFYDGMPWPPPGHYRSYLGYAEHSAWYSGDPAQLSLVYGGTAALGRYANFFGAGGPGIMLQPGSANNGIVGAIRNLFWGKQGPAPLTRLRVHIPMAADIASTSSDLLFARPPEFRVGEANEPKSSGNSKKVQDRLNEICEQAGMFPLLLEGAEVASAMGGVFLRLAWDKDFADTPILTIVHPDGALPEFTWGRLSAVTFWRVVEDEFGEVTRHLERHVPGAIMHALYKGSPTTLGEMVPLKSSPATAEFAAPDKRGRPDSTDEGFGAFDPRMLENPEAEYVPSYTDNIALIETGIKRLTAVYVPNMRPNRRERTLPLGRSDLEGVEGLMDSLDETWTSWMRDMRLGRARIIVPSEYLRTQGKGQGGVFDLDQEVFTPIEGMNPSDPQGGITLNQFNIRTAEHRDTAEALIERIVSTAGYSAATFGLDNGTSKQMRTATEVNAREARSNVTRNKKATYWGAPLAEILETALMIDAAFFGGPGAMPLRVEFSEAVEQDPSSIATSVELLARAGALSDYYKVKMTHPDMGEEDVQAEVKRLQADKGAAVPDPLTLRPPGATDGGPGGGRPGDSGGQ